MRLCQTALACWAGITAAAAVLPDQQQQQEQHALGISSASSSFSRRRPPVSTAVFGELERLARLVDIAYCVGTAGTGIAPPFSCASRCHEFPELRLVATWNTGVLMGDSCGFVAADDGRREVVVAFRGTYSVANTVEDLRTVPQKYVPYPDDGDGGGDGDSSRMKKKEKNETGGSWSCRNCTVHMGFFDSWQSARPLVLPAVAATREPSSSSRSSSSSSSPYRVHLVGHSLGGAVAALAGLEMRAALGWADVHVTTFGEPRIGNDGLADYLEAVFEIGDDGDNDNENDSTNPPSFHRVTHRNDPVPLLPLAEWGFRSHAGEIFIDKLDLPPAPEDVLVCRGRDDPACIAGPSDSISRSRHGLGLGFFLPRLRLWELFFAHRDYFWRLGLCLPGGDPLDRWRPLRHSQADSPASDDDL